jgi:hypothetical protein
MRAVRCHQFAAIDARRIRVRRPPEYSDLLTFFDPVEERLRSVHGVECACEHGIVIEQDRGRRAAERRLDLRQNLLNRHRRVPAVQAGEVRYFIFWSNDVIEETEASTINVRIREELVPRAFPQLF